MSASSQAREMPPATDIMTVQQLYASPSALSGQAPTLDSPSQSSMLPLTQTEIEEVGAPREAK